MSGLDIHQREGERERFKQHFVGFNSFPQINIPVEGPSSRCIGKGCNDRVEVFVALFDEKGGGGIYREKGMKEY